MVISAMLLWYDEPVELLRQAVTGAAVICDRIVAADGAYEFVPDARASSPRRQRLAIEQAATANGLEVSFLPPQVWPGQVTKRNAVLQEAKHGSDWVMTLDADWRITGSRAEIRAELAQMFADRYDEVAVNFVTPDDPSRDWTEKAANQWHVSQAGTYQRLAFIYRVVDKMEYRKNHWSIYCVEERRRSYGLFGAFNDLAYERAKSGFLQAPHQFEHLCLFRKLKQVLRNREYIAERDAAALNMGFET